MQFVNKQINKKIITDSGLLNCIIFMLFKASICDKCLIQLSEKLWTGFSAGWVNINIMQFKKRDRFCLPVASRQDHFHNLSPYNSLSSCGKVQYIYSSLFPSMPCHSLGLQYGYQAGLHFPATLFPWFLKGPAGLWLSLHIDETPVCGPQTKLGSMVSF